MFPGQGAQQPNMGRDIWEKHDKVKRIFSIASDIFGDSVEEICFHRPFQEVQRTDCAQIAIGTVSIALNELLVERGAWPDVVIGHSAGEMAALYASGAVSMPDVFKLITVRGRSMYEAALRHKGKMVAVVGASASLVHEVVRKYANRGVLRVGNNNAPEELVVTGDEDLVVLATQDLLQSDSVRIVDLKQQGAWHSEHMATAQNALAEVLLEIPIQCPRTPLLLNFSGCQVTDVSEIRRQLTEIVTGTVSWYPAIRKLAETMPRLFCEVGPNRILRGLVRKDLRDIDADSFDIAGVHDTQSVEVAAASIAGLRGSVSGLTLDAPAGSSV